MRARTRFALAIVSGLVVHALGSAMAPAAVPWWVRGVAGWDAASLTLLALVWNVILRAGPAETRHRASSDDPGRTAVFVLAVVASLVSLFASVFVLRRARDLPLSPMWTVLGLLAVVLSWGLTHSLYALRYAHLFYRRGNPGGLQFPGTPEPRDVDFAYFAFTLGMCFQTSDVVVDCTRVRRVVLVHTLLAFLYNTMILALALNLAFALLAPA
jgi:uncharacterized membrane protein